MTKEKSSQRWGRRDEIETFWFFSSIHSRRMIAFILALSIYCPPRGLYLCGVGGLELTDMNI